MLKKKTSFLILIFLAVASVAALSTLRGQTQENTTPPKQDNQKKIAEDFYTITDYDAPEPSDPKKRALRRVRAKRYNMPAQKGVDPKRFMITEDRESSFSTPPFDVPLEPALPIAQSDAVVIGEVTKAEALLTEDKTQIISEFSVGINDILKNNVVAPISIGDLIDTIRGGGAVRFPSGKILRQGSHGKPLPRIGKRYLFFLKYNNDGGGDFVIITAYELRAGCVFPLDGIDTDNKEYGRYADYQKYKNADEVEFLNEVREAIATASGGGK